MINELRESGVHFTYSRKPELPFGFYSLHHRNHRRITTIDGEIGYTGGFNIGDEYLGKDKRFGYWRDYHVRLKGEGAKDLEEQFALDWKRDTKENIKRSANKASKGNTLHTMASYNGHYVAEKYVKLINEARHSVVITTPYFIAKNKELMNALITAQKRGITVKYCGHINQIFLLLKRQHIRIFVKLLIMELKYMVIKRDVSWEVNVN